MKIKVAIADDHAIVRAGFKQFIEAQSDMELVAEASTGEEALALARKNRCDVLLLDISMPGLNGIDALRSIRATQNEIGILVLSGYGEEQYATSTLKMGANGYLRKDCEPEELLKAIRTVANGKRYITTSVGEILAAGIGNDSEQEPHETLSDRELQVFLRLAQGESISEIGETLHLSVKTISTYRSRILEKLQLRSNSELTYYAMKHALLD